MRIVWMVVGVMMVSLSLSARSAPVTPEVVLDYWFGELAGAEDFPVHKAGMWFVKSREVDQEIREKFGGAVEMAAAGRYRVWEKTPRGRLALVILLDQFSRNIYRGDPGAFGNDPEALRLALEGINQGEMMALYPIERAFLYLPLQHAEELSYQDQGVDLYRQLTDSVAAHLKGAFGNFHDSAVQHRDIIARFGRFPHRNGLLLRESSLVEREFLLQPGSSF